MNKQYSIINSQYSAFRVFGLWSLVFGVFVLFFFVGFVAEASVSEYRPAGPLSVRSQNPLYLQFLAMPMESPQSLGKKGREIIVSTTFSNVFEYDPVSNTKTYIDMELWRTAFQLKYGLTDEIDVQVEIPFITNSAGFLDPFIQGYHNLFGLPNAGRELVNDNEFHYQVSQNNIDVINYNQSSLGLSDVVLKTKYFFSHRIKLPFKLAVVSYLKLPTGLKSRGLGSGEVDFGASLFGEKSIKRFHFVSQVGFSFLGTNAVLSTIQKRGYFAFGQSVEFQIMDGWSVIAQLSGNTALFKNVDTTDLSDPVLDLSIGFAGRFKKFFYQWAFSEDVLSQGPSVDFSIMFLAGLRY